MNRQKHGALIQVLEDDKLYSPGTLTQWVKLPEGTRAEQRIFKQRLRITMARLAMIDKFPPEGDGMIRIRGQAPIRGWYGWRWKKALQEQGR